MRASIFFVLFLLLPLCKAFKPFFNEEELGHVRIARGGQPCNEDNLVNFLAEIQVINPESIVKIATLDEIQPMCHRVAENLEKIKNYLKTCTPANQPDLYLQLIRGVESLHDKICGDSPFKKRFEEAHKCLHELRNDLEDCSGPADWNENSDNAEVCKAYKDVSDCYYIKTAKVCGKSSAATTKELLKYIIDSILTINCDVNANPSVKDAMPDTYMNKQNGVMSLKPSLYYTTFTVIIYYTI